MLLTNLSHEGKWYFFNAESFALARKMPSVWTNVFLKNKEINCSKDKGDRSESKVFCFVPLRRVSGAHIMSRIQVRLNVKYGHSHRSKLTKQCHRLRVSIAQKIEFVNVTGQNVFI